MHPSIPSSIFPTLSVVLINTPMQSSIAAVYIVVADINFLINASSSVDYVLYGLTFVSLLIMRVTHCKTARPYKVEVHGVISREYSLRVFSVAYTHAAFSCSNSEHTGLYIAIANWKVKTLLHGLAVNMAR